MTSTACNARAGCLSDQTDCSAAARANEHVAKTRDGKQDDCDGVADQAATGPPTRQTSTLDGQ